MTKLPVFFGYAGTIPFILLMLSMVFVDNGYIVQIAAYIQLGYGAMILSFLAGAHWLQSINSNNIKQLSFSMMPTVICLGLMVYTLIYGAFVPLIVMAALFWVIYTADRKFTPPENVPGGYFKFRLRLTVIVSFAIALSATSFVF